jgi:hypothetical protein
MCRLISSNQPLMFAVHAPNVVGSLASPAVRLLHAPTPVGQATALTTQQCAPVLVVGRRWFTTSNRRQSRLILDACGSATGRVRQCDCAATPMVTRDPMESFDMSHPIARTFDLSRLSRNFLSDPYPTYRALREHSPVHRLPDGSFFLTRYLVRRSATIHCSVSQVEWHRYRFCGCRRSVAKSSVFVAFRAQGSDRGCHAFVEGQKGQAQPLEFRSRVPAGGVRRRSS